jgi:predicted nucleic acid-binding protein
VIILDTSVLSETVKPSPSERVLGWLAVQDPLRVYTTTITQAEILSGVELLPVGKRRAALADGVAIMFREDFSGRILPFDEEAAHAFAKILATRNAMGRPMAQLDAMMAAVARSHSATLATRNTGDFEHCGVLLVNPWAT